MTDVCENNETEQSADYWTAIECNPEALSKAMIVDVFSLDEELLAFLPQPVYAFIMLFPVTTEYQATCEEQVLQFMAGKSQEELHPKNVYFTKQTIGNACGTVALIHAVCNNLESLFIEPDSVIGRFYSATSNMTPEERAEFLKFDRGFYESHTEAAQEGQTEAPAADASIRNHFIALIRKNGRLYELDGRKPCPIDYGSTSEESFLQDSVKVVKDFIALQPETLMFTLLALVATPT